MVEIKSFFVKTNRFENKLLVEIRWIQNPASFKETYKANFQKGPRNSIILYWKYFLRKKQRISKPNKYKVTLKIC